MSGAVLDRSYETRFSVSASVEFESPEAALERLVQLQEVDFGDVFNNRETELESEESGLSIQFYHDEELNSLVLNTDNEKQVNISLLLTDSAIARVENILATLLDAFCLITVDQIYIDKYYDTAFETLDLPIEPDPDLSVTGLRVQYQGWDCIVQDISDNETSGTIIAARTAENLELDDEVPDGFTTEYIQEIDQFMEEVSE